MNKNILLLAAFFVVLFNTSVFSQQLGRLYISSATTGRIYDITTGVTPTLVTTPAGVNANLGTAVTNLAVGYDSPAQPNTLVYIHSNTTAASAINKNGAATGVTLPVAMGGFGTNNVPGTYFGQVFGFQSASKNLYRVYPTASAAMVITGDATWNLGTVSILLNDTMFDYLNNIYTIVSNSADNSRYLYKITITSATTATAAQVAQVTGPVATITNSLGSAYLNGKMYVVDNTNPQVLYTVDLITGVSVTDRTFDASVNFTGSKDLASVDYYLPFQFNCGGATFISGNPFVPGYTSTRTLRIPITAVYAPGTYTISVSGTDFNTVNQSVTITGTTTFVDVPMTYTGGGTAGTRTLTIGLSTTTCTTTATIESDTDSDGLANSIDLDSDNDGILDIFECTQSVVSQPYNTSNGTTVSFSAPAADLGFIFDVYTLDNSFNLNINGVNLATSEIQFQPDQVDNIRFIGGERYGNGSIPQIYTMTGNATNPLVRIIIHKNGGVMMYGSKAGNGPLFPLELYNGNAFNTITWNRTGANSIILSQAVVGTTYITGNGNGLQNGFCDPEGDLISNQYDTDSDGDGCPDAIEGSETVKYDQVHALSLLSGDPNYPYRGQIKVLANGTTTGTPSQVISTVTAASGVPLLLNNAANNTGGVAGVADNTDGTSDIGQGIGSAQDAATNACICYNPVVTAGTRLTTSHGITSLNRAGAANSNWPMVRNGAWTALEAKTKGFVLNRLTTAQIAAIPTANLIEGMMVYNTSSDCLQINTDGTAAGWKCFDTQTCTAVN